MTVKLSAMLIIYAAKIFTSKNLTSNTFLHDQRGNFFPIKPTWGIGTKTFFTLYNVRVCQVVTWL